MANVLYIRLSDADYELCKKAAELDRLPVTAWARHHILKVAERAPGVVAKPEPLTIAQKAAARDALARAKVVAGAVAQQKAEWVRLLRDPRQAHLSEAQMHGMMRDTCNSQQPDIRPRYEAAMQEAIAEVGGKANDPSS